MNTTKINSVEAIMLVLTIVVTHTILSLPRTILAFSKSATLLNIVYVSVIAILISYVIFRLFKNFSNSDIIDVSEFLGGKTLKNIIGIIFIIYFITTSSILLRNFCESLKIIYFPMTSLKYIVLLFFVALSVANRFNFNSIIKTNALILPIFFVSVLFLFFTNFNKFVPQRIFPIFGEGIFRTFGLGLINLSSFSGIVCLYFIPPMLKEPKKFKKVCVISIIIYSIYLILCIATLLFMFSFFITENEVTPLYTATRYIEFGNFFQRLESVFLLCWILAFACYLSCTMQFSIRIFQKMTNIENRNELINISLLLIFAITMTPENYSISGNLEIRVYPYFVLALVFIVSLLILIFANLKNKKLIRKADHNG